MRSSCKASNAGIVIKLLMTSTLGFVLLGCTTTRQNRPPKDDFLSKKGSVALVAVVQEENPVASYYQVGGQGLLDKAIVSAARSSVLGERLKKEQLMPIVKQHFFDTFGTALKDAGFEVEIIAEPVVESTLKDFTRPPKTSKADYAEYDFAGQLKDTSADYLLVITVKQFGVSRSYYGFIATGPAKGTSQIAVHLVERSSNKVLAEFPATVSTRAADGTWDEPPEFPLLMQSATASFVENADAAFEMLFGRAP